MGDLKTAAFLKIPTPARMTSHSCVDGVPISVNLPHTTYSSTFQYHETICTWGRIACNLGEGLGMWEEVTGISGMDML